MLVATWHILTTGEIYNDPAATTSLAATPNAPPDQLIAQLEKLGHNVILETKAAA